MKYLVLISMILISCKSSISDLERERASVMKIHDDAMAKIGEVQNNTYKLQEMLDRPDSNDIKVVIQQLEEAEESMMLWMQEYKEPDKEKLSDYYASEKIKIQKVADQIDKSLENAQKYIDK